VMEVLYGYLCVQWCCVIDSSLVPKFRLILIALAVVLWEVHWPEFEERQTRARFATTFILNSGVQVKHPYIRFAEYRDQEKVAI